MVVGKRWALRWMIIWAAFFPPSWVTAYDFFAPSLYDPLARNPIWERRVVAVHLDLDSVVTPPPPGGPWNPVAEGLLDQWEDTVGP